MNFSSLFEPALEQVRIGFKEGGLPVGAALFDEKGAQGGGKNRIYWLKCFLENAMRASASIELVSPRLSISFKRGRMPSPLAI